MSSLKLKKNKKDIGIKKSFQLKFAYDCVIFSCKELDKIVKFVVKQQFRFGSQKKCL